MRSLIKVLLIFLPVSILVACGGDSTSPSAGLDGNWSAQVGTHTVGLRLLPPSNGLYSGDASLTVTATGATIYTYLDVSAVPFSGDSVSIIFLGVGTTPDLFFRGISSGSRAMSGTFSGALSGTASFTKQ